METILSGIERMAAYIEFDYLMLVWLFGWLLSKDGVIAPLPPKLRLTLLMVNTFYRVLILSGIIALLYIWLVPETAKFNLLITFLVANTMYEAGVKNLIYSFEKLLQKIRV